MRHPTRRHTAKKVIRPPAVGILPALAAARTAAKVLADAQRAIEAEAGELAALSSLIGERLASVGALASVVGNAGGEWNEQLATLNGITTEAARYARQLAGDLREWANARAPLSTAVVPAKPEKGGAR